MEFIAREIQAQGDEMTCHHYMASGKAEYLSLFFSPSLADAIICCIPAKILFFFSF